MHQLAQPAVDLGQQPAHSPPSESIGRRVEATLQRHNFAVLLVLMFGYYLWIDLVWHAIDQRPPRWDEGHTLMIAEHSYQSLQQGELLKALSLKDISNTKPGMVPFLSALSYFAIGNSWVLATIVANACAMFTILFVLLRAGRDFYDSAAVGALAFLCFCNLNSVLVWSGYYQTDLPMTAAVCATVWLCWAIDRANFVGKGLAILLALSIAIGMGIKHLYVVFVFAPLALFIVRALVQFHPSFRIQFRQRGVLLACLFIGIALGTSYHLLNIHILKEHIARSKNAALTGGIGSPQSSWKVFASTVSILPPWAWGILLSVSFIWAMTARRRRMLYPVLCVVGGFFGVGLTASWPLGYYFIPLMPLGLFIAAGILGLPLPWTTHSADAIRIRRMVLVEALVVILALQYSLNRLGTWNVARVARQTPAILASFGQANSNPLVDTPYWQNVTIDGNDARLPYPGGWQVDAFIAEIRQRMATLPATRPYSLLYCTGSYEWMTAEYARYEIKKRHLWNALYMSSELPPDKTPEQILADFDFVILKTGKAMKVDFYSSNWGPPFQDFVDGLTKNDYEGLKTAGFEPLQKRGLPDGSEGSLWMSSRRISGTQPS